MILVGIGKPVAVSFHDKVASLCNATCLFFMYKQITLTDDKLEVFVSFLLYLLSFFGSRFKCMRLDFGNNDVYTTCLSNVL